MRILESVSLRTNHCYLHLAVGTIVLVVIRRQQVRVSLGKRPVTPVVRFVVAVGLAGTFRQAVRLLRHGVRPSVGGDGPVRRMAVVPRTVTRQTLQAQVKKKRHRLERYCRGRWKPTGSIFLDFNREISTTQ